MMFICTAVLVAISSYVNCMRIPRCANRNRLATNSNKYMHKYDYRQSSAVTRLHVSLSTVEDRLSIGGVSDKPSVTPVKPTKHDIYTGRDPSRVKIFDTTLRDGEQSPGCTMTGDEKMAVAKQLAKLGVDVIEAGTYTQIYMHTHTYTHM